MTTRVAMIQFDAVPEAVERNLEQMRDWVAKASETGARWIMFHEGTLCDYTPRLSELAEDARIEVRRRACAQVAPGVSARNDSSPKQPHVRGTVPKPDDMRRSRHAARDNSGR